MSFDWFPVNTFGSDAKVSAIACFQYSKKSQSCSRSFEEVFKVHENGTFAVLYKPWFGEKVKDLEPGRKMKNLLFDISRFFSKLPTVSLEAVAAGAAVGAGRLL